MVGIVLPVLPTTPFVLLAAWCAGRGSARLHAWLLAHPRFGPVIHEWELHGAVSRKAKRFALGTMALSVAVMWIVVPRPWVAALATAVMIPVAGWLWMRPEPDEQPRA